MWRARCVDEAHGGFGRRLGETDRSKGQHRAPSRPHRPKRSAHQAIEVMREAVRQGRTWVVDADIESFFDRLGFDLVLDCLRERISDRKVLKLIRVILEAGVLDGTSLSFPAEGSPQGGPLSPVLANVVLHRLDRTWQQQYHRLGILVRYADDLCVLCPTQERAEAALAALHSILDGLGLKLAPAKTRIVGVADGTDGYDFLGFHHRMVPSRRHPKFRYPACWPSAKATSRARSRIREMTGRNRCHAPTRMLVEDLNQFLRGWRQYFRLGNSSHCFAKLDRYVFERMALLISKRHGRSGRGNGMKHIIMSGDRLGLESLVGNVAYGRTVDAAR
ncbi:MAG: maturase [Micromonosporaceae bacterium]|nr:maturase [Micromonosporaceae bacterium]